MKVEMAVLGSPPLIVLMVSCVTYRKLDAKPGFLPLDKPDTRQTLRQWPVVSGGSGGVVNSPDFCPASLKSQLTSEERGWGGGCIHSRRRPYQPFSHFRLKKSVPITL